MKKKYKWYLLILNVILCILFIISFFDLEEMIQRRKVNTSANEEIVQITSKDVIEINFDTGGKSLKGVCLKFYTYGHSYDTGTLYYRLYNRSTGDMEEITSMPMVRIINGGYAEFVFNERIEGKYRLVISLSAETPIKYLGIAVNQNFSKEAGIEVKGDHIYEGTPLCLFSEVSSKNLYSWDILLLWIIIDIVIFLFLYEDGESKCEKTS